FRSLYVTIHRRGYHDITNGRIRIDAPSYAEKGDRGRLPTGEETLGHQRCLGMPHFADERGNALVRVPRVPAPVVAHVEGAARLRIFHRGTAVLDPLVKLPELFVQGDQNPDIHSIATGIRGRNPYIQRGAVNSLGRVNQIIQDGSGKAPTYHDE